MNKTKGLLFTASLVLAITFTISCEDKEAKGKPAETNTVAAVPETAVTAPPPETAEKTVPDKRETFTDSRDGKTYKTVTISLSPRHNNMTQTWMTENMNYAAKGSKCYDNKDENCAKYGRVYDKNTAGQACPEDWRLPYDDGVSSITFGLYSVGFDAIGGGFSNTSDLGYWIITLENDEINVWYKGMFYDPKSKDLPSNTSGLFSVRCVQAAKELKK